MINQHGHHKNNVNKLLTQLYMAMIISALVFRIPEVCHNNLGLSKNNSKVNIFWIVILNVYILMNKIRIMLVSFLCFIKLIYKLHCYIL